MTTAGAILIGAACYALALPPFDQAWLAWFALVPLLVTVRGASGPRAFGYGLLFGCACCASITWWAVHAMGRYFGMGLPLAVAAAAAIYLVVSIPTFAAFAVGASILLSKGRPSSTGVAVAALWVGTEIVRGRLLGQPWGLLGYTQHAQVGLVQLATLGGVYAVSFVVAFGGVALAEALVVLHRDRDPRGALLVLAAPFGAITACWVGGALIAYSGPTGGFGGHEVAVVQTNVPPAYHWTRPYTERQILAHVRATSDISGHPALVVWPENSVPRYLDSEPFLAAQLAQLATQRNADLLIGGPRWSDGRIHNSVRLLTKTGHDGGYYDKQHLVLFAEEQPFSHHGTDKRNDSPSEFTPGTTPGVMSSFVRLGVTICHEIIYPELVRRSVAEGAELLVNVSNDGWLDGGTGVASEQHFAMAVFRAVEARRYLVRAATTGVSGMVDPYGRVLGVLPPRATGVLTAPVAGRRNLTFYVYAGDVFALACAALAAAALVPAFPPFEWRRRSVVAAVHTAS